MEVLLNKEPTDITVNALTMPNYPSPNKQVVPPEEKSIFSGMTIANLSPPFAKLIGLDIFETGVIVLNIKNRSLAHISGFLPGDRLISFDHIPLKNVKQTMELIKSRNTSALFWLQLREMEPCLHQDCVINRANNDKPISDNF